ncbi:hypothetical protein [Leptolyngbya sp. FACHB-17]|uniref:hypothetical protein n=1 Tax=unclassified Leptolyngbya TaxID=2650499 RepID=UPI0016812DA3|nr:hypothetical protein [Leptolyngbya sp. FACHB-17]MBD2078732.1 hypothetical protein [Leptolyngbya sp. FACHB-17]
MNGRDAINRVSTASGKFNICHIDLLNEDQWRNNLRGCAIEKFKSRCLCDDG